VDASDAEHDDVVLRWVARRLWGLQQRLNGVLYYRLAAPFERRNDGQPWLYFNYVYVFALWVPVVTAAYFLSGNGSGGWWLLLAVPGAWRWLEVLVWWVKLLLDRTHTNILAAERNLMFLAVDAAVVIAASTVIWRTSGWGKSVSWVDAFATFSLNGPPPATQGAGPELLAGLLALTGLLLLGGGLALLIGIVGTRVKVVPEQYTGPRGSSE